MEAKKPFRWTKINKDSYEGSIFEDLYKWKNEESAGDDTPKDDDNKENKNHSPVRK